MWPKEKLVRLEDMLSCWMLWCTALKIFQNSHVLACSYSIDGQAFDRHVDQCRPNQGFRKLVWLCIELTDLMHHGINQQQHCITLITLRRMGWLLCMEKKKPFSADVLHGRKQRDSSVDCQRCQVKGRSTSIALRERRNNTRQHSRT